jgi:two-component system, OmpR family, sensor kinase
VARDLDGHGLGLAIARHAVQQHGGTITARPRDGGGLVVRLELPRNHA